MIRRILVALLLAVIAITAVIGFGVSPRDNARIAAFVDAVRRWQTNPDFRAVQNEYVTLGVEAMRGRLCGLSAQTIVMGFRSLPGLPDSLTAKDSSAPHYRAFSAGEMAAYLHLSGEQDVVNGVGMIEDFGKRDVLTDADIVKFLSDFKLPIPVVTDAGAVASVRRLIDDVKPATPFFVRSNVLDRLRPRTAESLQALDEQVKRADFELWRTKQVNDFLGGIWAQSYGVIYLQAIEWFRLIQRLSRVTAITLALLLVAWGIRRTIRSSISDPNRAE